MKTKQKHLAILISFFVASSIAAPITNPQAAQPAVLPQSAQSNPDQLILVAVLKVNAELRAKDFARRSDANLPSVLRGAKIRPALAQAFSSANDRLPATHPSQILRRTVLTEMKLGNRSIEAIRSDLLATGLFESIELGVKPATVVAFSALDELSNPEGLSDNARKQWALPTIKAELAWAFTNGRANIGSLEGGIQTGHPDLAPNLIAQSSAFPKLDGVGGLKDWEPGVLGTILDPLIYPASFNDFIAHGMNVNSLMAGSWQSKSSTTPSAGSGVVGVCPSCKFSTLRLIDSAAYTDAFPWFSKNSGVTAINMSFGADFKLLTPTFLNAALQVDVVLVSAAGNGNVDAANPATSQYPSSHPGVISVGASDFQDKRWDEKRIAGLAIPLRHAGIGDRYVIDYRCNIQQPTTNFVQNFPWKAECGSSNDARVDVYAPGVQMIGALDRRYIEPGLLKRTRELNAQTPFLSNANPYHIASMGIGIGNSGSARINTSGTPNIVTGIHSFDTNGQGPGILDPTDPAGYAKVGVVPIVESGFGSLNYTQWGPMTGTSMATPMVTGTVGLMRSINPMVSVASVRALLKSSAMDTITEHQFNLPPPAEPPQYKRLNMENAVKSTLASVRGIQQVNRLIPMFSMRATQSQQFIRDTKGNGESASWEKDDPFETSAIDSWLFTTSTQVATAGLTGDLAYTGFQDTNDDFGTDQRTQFKAGATYGTGGALPSY